MAIIPRCGHLPFPYHAGAELTAAKNQAIHFLQNGARPAYKHQVVCKVMCSSLEICQHHQTQLETASRISRKDVVVICFTFSCSSQQLSPEAACLMLGLLWTWIHPPVHPLVLERQASLTQALRPLVAQLACPQLQQVCLICEANNICHADHLSISMFLGLGSGICLKSVGVALRCSLLPLLPGLDHFTVLMDCQML